MKFKILFLSVAFSGVIFNGYSAVQNITMNNNAAYEAAYNTMTLEDQRQITTLENDIRLLDDEIAKCQKKKKGWIAATVIGGAGVLSTGIAAVAQGVKISDKKDTLADKQQELNTIQEQNRALTIN